MTNNNNPVSWKNRWTFIMAATGSAVGLGNIWKFPYITGEYGGGAFVLVYLVCILALGIPVMMAEVMVGRAGRTDPTDSMSCAAQQSGLNPAWALAGALGVLAGLMILMFYSVVAGWALDYVVQSISGTYMQANASIIEGNFGKLTQNINNQLLWHSVFIVMTIGVIAGGVTKGIGKAVEILMPLLFVLLLILLGYSLAEGDFSAALTFMFAPDFSKLSASAILVALGHAFFTLSLGMGAIMAYGAYMPGDASIGKTVLSIAALDTVIALVAGMAMFPLVFANGLEPGAGPGLMFVTLPIAFSNMALGGFFGTVFFVLVAIAALSSAISLLEPGVAWLERRQIKRPLAALSLGVTAWTGGVISIYQTDVFDFLDYVTANIMLPLCGLLIAIFVGWMMKPSKVWQEMQFSSERWRTVWYWALKLVAPTGIVIIFANSLGWIS